MVIKYSIVFIVVIWFGVMLMCVKIWVRNSVYLGYRYLVRILVMFLYVLI